MLVLMAWALPVSSVVAKPDVKPDDGFQFATVVGIARALSQSPYKPPQAPLPEFLAGMNYDQYRNIEFNRESAIWAKSRLNFQMQLFHRGFLFLDPVEITLVSQGQRQRLAYSPEFFKRGHLVAAPLPSEDLGYSGFRLHYRLNNPRIFEEFVVFQGASYFRAVGKRQNYGQSARGLAIKTADPRGEEFPVFRAFWVEEPPRTSRIVVVNAVLDSPSVAGAYRFTIRPGNTTVIDVEAVLFPRADLRNVGLAPATSMYLFSASGRARFDDFRPQVHDTDGLLVLNGHGEMLWRPLANPSTLQVSAFQDRSLRGFGLMQRDRDPRNYQDLEALYHTRPSLWIEPDGDWGEGAVVLTEIPSAIEIHDNIVAFWSPRKIIPAGSEFRFAYRMHWGGEPKVSAGYARVVATRRGRPVTSPDDPGTLFVLDYSGLPAGRKSRELPKPTVTASQGKVRNVVVRDNPETGGYRLTFILDPGKFELSELRAELAFDKGHRAEVWVYRWTAP
jgi:glucans biosynthesis protein